MALDDLATVPAETPALVLTISDGVAAGVRQDDAGAALAEWLITSGFRVDRTTVADERPAIEAAL
ncbi:MAG: hypothetical protein ABI620_09165, partial [Chloroflexota bacterium]